MNTNEIIRYSVKDLSLDMTALSISDLIDNLCTVKPKNEYQSVNINLFPSIAELKRYCEINDYEATQIRQYNLRRTKYSGKKYSRTASQALSR